MPLDAERFAWTTNFPLWFEALGLLLLIGSAFLLFRSYKDNSFLSPWLEYNQKEIKKLYQQGSMVL